MTVSPALLWLELVKLSTKLVDGSFGKNLSRNGKDNFPSKVYIFLLNPIRPIFDRIQWYFTIPISILKTLFSLKFVWEFPIILLLKYSYFDCVSNKHKSLIFEPMFEPGEGVWPRVGPRDYWPPTQKTAVLTTIIWKKP